MSKEWTDREKRFLIENCDDMSDSEISIHISKMRGENVNAEAIKKKRQRLKIKKKRGNFNKQEVKMEGFGDFIGRLVKKQNSNLDNF